MKKLTAHQFKQHLQRRSHDELIRDLTELFSKFEVVKDFYSTRLLGGFDKQLLEAHKARIKQEFFPSRGFGSAKLSVARKAVTDYKKIASSQEGLIELMAYYVEMGIQFTNTYGDINEAFYNSMESMFENAAKLVVENDLQAQYEGRFGNMVNDTSGIGWGFHDQLSDIYEEYFGEVP